MDWNSWSDNRGRLPKGPAAPPLYRRGKLQLLVFLRFAEFFYRLLAIPAGDFPIVLLSSVSRITQTQDGNPASQATMKRADHRVILMRITKSRPPSE